jgi:hypothetical protein
VASVPASSAGWRAPLALALALVALLVVAVIPPLALLPAAAAVVLGADARQRGLTHGFAAHRMASAALLVGAVAIAVAVALTVVGLSGA